MEPLGKEAVELFSPSPVLKADADHLGILQLQNRSGLAFRVCLGFRVRSFSGRPLCCFSSVNLEKAFSAAAVLWISIFWVSFSVEEVRV